MEDPGGPLDTPIHLDASAALADLAMQVDRDNVLGARSALLREADRLDEGLRRHRVALYDGISDCGRDPVSPEATAAFNRRIASLVVHCSRYIDDLRAGAHNLECIARDYGLTEDEIVQSLNWRP